MHRIPEAFSPATHSLSEVAVASLKAQLMKWTALLRILVLSPTKLLSTMAMSTPLEIWHLESSSSRIALALLD
jgi:hypothetical protein